MENFISRQAAIKIIQSMYPGMPRVPWMRKNWQKQYKPYIRTENAIRELPSADIRENVRGEWIPCGGSFRCSECASMPEFKDIRRLHFCPNCGADMR